MDTAVRLITGASDGFGKYVAAKLAALGGTLLLHGRQADKLQGVAADIRQCYPTTAIEIYVADFSDIDQISNMANAISKQHTRLNLLINNAGIGLGSPHSERSISRNGYELRFAVNYLAPYLLTKRLQPLLKAAGQARVVNIASLGQHPLDFTNLQLERDYSGMRAYGQSKLALIMATFDWAQAWRANNITANALHPATYAATKMVAEAGISPLSSIADGGEAIAWLATDADLASTSGVFFNQRTPTKADPQAYDLSARQRLRLITDELLQPYI